jgi:hypothetical protein
MITRIVIMRPGAADETGSVDLPEPPSYRDLDRVLRPLLDGGDLEHVLVYTGAEPFLGEHAYRDMFVDEEGHEKVFRPAADGSAVRDRAGKNLPRNEAATALNLRNCRMHEPEKPDDPDYFIVGPAVLFPDRRVWS